MTAENVVVRIGAEDIVLHDDTMEGDHVRETYWKGETRMGVLCVDKWRNDPATDGQYGCRWGAYFAYEQEFGGKPFEIDWNVEKHSDQYARSAQEAVNSLLFEMRRTWEWFEKLPPDMQLAIRNAQDPEIEKRCPPNRSKS